MLVIFVSLELLSISLYILTAFNKRSRQSWEAALKYFLFGGMSAAFLLFGFSLLYGLSDSIELTAIAASLQWIRPLPCCDRDRHHRHWPRLQSRRRAIPLLGARRLPGRTTPSAAFIASSSKIASFFVFFLVLAFGITASSNTRHTRPVGPRPRAVAALSMLLGNLVAIGQTSLRRLLAYSAIAHAGYMLLAI